ncbi:MAG: signal peptide peptidase SppA [Pseudomonadales bacterium]|nr:signal peptide peptidase SppA [Pseudomonadales bacterium]
MVGRIFAGAWRAIGVARNTTFNLIFLLLAGFILLGIFSTESISVPESTALIINPTGVIVEQKKSLDPFAEFLSGYENNDTETRLIDILDAIETAATDDRVKVLVLDLSKLQGAAFSKLEEIGNALETFKHSGKPVYAFAKSYPQNHYYIAAHSDQIFLDQNSHQMLGGVFLTGLGVYPTYYKAALDKFKVNFHIYKAGLYKSAVEPFERNSMSDVARSANLSWLTHLWQEYTQTIITQRDISSADFKHYTNHYDELLSKAAGNPNLLAVQQGLVDDTISYAKWQDMLTNIVGPAGTSFSQIGLKDYLDATRPALPLNSPDSNKIAVITASGVIHDGEQPAGSIGSDSIIKLIRQARQNQTVKALVIRVDSPGGSASASEEIRNELVLAQKQGKPVVISMGSYAASGGYWIAASANKIFAASTTITGSIGAFALLPTLEKTAAEWGIHSDGVGTTTLSNSANILQDINPIFDHTIQQSLQFTYNRFIELVADGRGMQAETVEALSQGRVWAAQDALKHGLIDAIGNLKDAISSAALLAKLGNYEVLYLEKSLSPKEQLLNKLVNSGLQSVYSAVEHSDNLSGLSGLRAISNRLNGFIKLSKQPGLYVQCMECILK